MTSQSEEGGSAHSLSSYLPKDTVYFYSFPSGEDSKFFNNVPPWKEELVAARPLICAGNDITVVTFARSVDPLVWDLMENHLGVSLLQKDRVIALPETITADLHGHERNTHIKKALKELVPPKSLIMGQPYLDEEFEDRYQLSPELTVKLNDKLNRTFYISKEYLPHQHEAFLNGESFLQDETVFPFPCVCKVSSSSSGDGVRICRSPEDLKNAKEEFKLIQGNIIIEEYIEAVYNFGIQFGIPFDKKKSIEIIGYNEQMTSDQGDYLGGIIDPSRDLPILEKIYSILLKSILPKVRKLGWYGVGGLDVLVGKDDKFYFIDPNFRMTAAFAYIYLSKNKIIQKPIVTFTGVFQGSEEAFKKKIVPIAVEGKIGQKMTIITLARTSDSYQFNAGMFFDERMSIGPKAKELLALGINSKVLDRISLL